MKLKVINGDSCKGCYFNEGTTCAGKGEQTIEGKIYRCARDGIIYVLNEEEIKKDIDKSILDMFNPHKQNKYRRNYKYVKPKGNVIKVKEEDSKQPV